MIPNFLENKKRIHFIGIGGSGMYPIVEILHKKGYQITGSDNNESDIVKMERALGIPVVMEQQEENIIGADLIVYSAAISSNNPERKAAEESGILTVERSKMLGLITQWFSHCICIAGTHGKTTATSMLTEMLIGAQRHPSYFIGGKLKSTGHYGRLDNPDLMTCEACEFSNTFLELSPSISVLLNIDCDHLDYFKTMENLKESFCQFCSNASALVLYNGDDPNSREVIGRLSGKKVLSFGLNSSNDYYAAQLKTAQTLGTSFSLCHQGESIAKLTTPVPGNHNVLNAVAAAAAALQVGVSPAQLQNGLLQYQGAGRRFEKLGEIGGVTIMDDYAHHPAEIAATLRAAKTLDYQNVWALHQPFTYSRTKLLLDDFAEALSIADQVVLTDIMGGREEDIYGITSDDLAQKTDRCVRVNTQRQAADYILNHAKPGDLVITLGCGDIYKAAQMMLYGSYDAKDQN